MWIPRFKPSCLALISGLMLFGCAQVVVVAPLVAPKWTGVIKSSPIAEGCGTVPYPAAALRKGQAGTIIILLDVLEDGGLASVNIRQSSGWRDLDYAAWNGIRPCKINPALVDGKPIRSTMEVSYVWAID